MRLNQISGEVVDAAMRIHMRLGPGLFESVYEGLLVYELEKRGMKVERQVPIPVVYDEIKMPDGFRADPRCRTSTSSRNQVFGTTCSGPL